MSMNFLPFAALAPEDQRDSKLIRDRRLVSDRWGCPFRADDITQVATRAGGDYIQVMRGAVRKARRQPVEGSFDVRPASHRFYSPQDSNGIVVRPQILSRSCVAVMHLCIGVALPRQYQGQEFINVGPVRHPSHHLTSRYSGAVFNTVD